MLSINEEEIDAMPFDDFMNYMGYRNSVVENKIDECLTQIRNGKTDITITRGDMTDSELEYLQSELERRINKK